MKFNTLQGRGSSIIQMVAKSGIFVIFLTKTFICHHLGLIQCVPPDDLLGPLFDPCSEPAGRALGRAPSSGAPRGVWGSPKAVRGLHNKLAN